MRIILLGLLILTQVGCSHLTYNSKNLKPKKNSMSIYSSANETKALAKKKYFLLSGMDNISSYDKQFSHLSKYIHNALQMKGFVPVEEFSKSELAIFVIYKKEDPKEYSFEYSYPHRERQGGGTTKFQIHSSDSYGYSRTHGSIDTPTTYKTTYVTEKEYATAYLFSLALIACNTKYEEIWRIGVSSGTNSPATRIEELFPVMALGASDYIGVNMATTISISILDDDPRLEQLSNIHAN